MVEQERERKGGKVEGKWRGKEGVLARVSAMSTAGIHVYLSMSARLSDGPARNVSL